MSRLSEYVNKKQGMMFIPFITAGDPNEATTIELAYLLQSLGASALELGIPFSDPLADGPVIQKASKRALKNGMNLQKALQLAKKIRQRGVNIPIIIFTYYNLLLQLGEETFIREAKAGDVDGLLVPDLPFEESRELSEKCRENGLALISLVAPTTSDKRLQAIGGAAQGFLYCVSSLGVTGVRSHFHPDVFSFLARVRKACDSPIAVGFGISSSAQVEELKGRADGFIVGSAIVGQVEKHAKRLERPDERAQALDDIREHLERTLLRNSKVVEKIEGATQRA